MKTVLALFLALVVVFSGNSLIIAADNSIDLKGYGKAKWGMTPEQVLAVESRAIKKTEKYSNGSVALLAIPDLEIKKVHFEAGYMFKDNKLKAVSLGALTKKPSSCQDLEFQFIEQSLTEKYGAPSLRTAGKHEGKSTWRLPSTSIVLSYLGIDGIKENLGCTSVMSIVYEQVGASNDNL